eukprot:2802146-Prymnesium_polylepis.1
MPSSGSMYEVTGPAASACTGPGQRSTHRTTATGAGSPGERERREAKWTRCGGGVWVRAWGRVLTPAVVDYRGAPEHKAEHRVVAELRGQLERRQALLLGFGKLRGSPTVDEQSEHVLLPAGERAVKRPHPGDGTGHLHGEVAQDAKAFNANIGRCLHDRHELFEHPKRRGEADDGAAEPPHRQRAEEFALAGLHHERGQREALRVLLVRVHGDLDAAAQIQEVPVDQQDVKHALALERALLLRVARVRPQEQHRVGLDQAYREAARRLSVADAQRMHQLRAERVLHALRELGVVLRPVKDERRDMPLERVLLVLRLGIRDAPAQRVQVSDAALAPRRRTARKVRVPPQVAASGREGFVRLPAKVELALGGERHVGRVLAALGNNAI